MNKSKIIEVVDQAIKALDMDDKFGNDIDTRHAEEEEAFQMLNCLKRELNGKPSKEVEKGAASILIDKTGGDITVYHGTDKVPLREIANAMEGSWDEIWEAIDNIKSV